MAEMESSGTKSRLQHILLDNKEAVETITYGVAAIGLYAVIQRNRPFTRFKKPLQVPPSYIKRKVLLHGYVKRIDPTGGIILMVDHKPLISLPRFWKENYLPVKLANINTTTNGLSWLQTVVGDKEVRFIPLARSKEYLECIVKMVEGDKGDLNIGEQLVKLGFATVDTKSSEIAKDKQVLKYQKTLKYAEKEAMSKRNGYWHFVLPPSILWKIKAAFHNATRNLFPSLRVQQSNI